MKRVIGFILITVSLLLCATSCDLNLNAHTHTMSDWKFNGATHWRVQECNVTNCTTAQGVYDVEPHVNGNDDDFCDVCGYKVKKSNIESPKEDDTSNPSNKETAPAEKDNSTSLPKEDDTTTTLPEDNSTDTAPDDTEITEPPTDSTDDNITIKSRFEKKEYFTGNTSVKYWLYTPENATDDMPLIVYLHGGSGKGDDLELIVAVDGFPQYLRDGIIKPDAYVIIPQISSDYTGWGGKIKDEVIKLIDSVTEEHNIDEDRISLTGHSMGGTGVFKIALAYSENFSAIAPLSAGIDLTSKNIEELKNLPVWAIVGTDDTIVDPKSSIDFVTELAKVNDNAKITVLSGIDHFTVPKSAYLSDDFDLIKWLTEQSK